MITILLRSAKAILGNPRYALKPIFDIGNVIESVKEVVDVIDDANLILAKTKKTECHNLLWPQGLRN